MHEKDLDSDTGSIDLRCGHHQLQLSGYFYAGYHRSDYG
jgi:hypothetical protein